LRYFSFDFSDVAKHVLMHKDIIKLMHM
jgi:hypothetical protein